MQSLIFTGLANQKEIYSQLDDTTDNAVIYMMILSVTTDNIKLVTNKEFKDKYLEVHLWKENAVDDYYEIYTFECLSDCSIKVGVRLL